MYLTEKLTFQNIFENIYKSRFYIVFDMSLKEEFLELLEKDKEFRHTVAGIIGYGDILESIKKHDKKNSMR